MTRIRLGYFIIAGLVLWGSLGTIAAGPSAILYTLAAAFPVWWFSCRSEANELRCTRHLSNTTCTLLAIFSVSYLLIDALFGRRLFQYNMFLHGNAGESELVNQLNEGMSKGGGVFDLLGTILGLLPLALVDATQITSRLGKWILWIIAILFLFYQAGAGRGFVMIVIVSIVMGRTSDWKRIVFAGALAFAAFSLASSFRGDFENTSNPLLAGVAAPVGNLALMLNAKCGSAPSYAFLAEFLKKFLPAFLVPKNIFSFNMEMSLCIYPSIDNTVTSVSVFTWLGEIYYYKPSLLTAIVAGCILGGLTRVVDRQLVKYQLISARIFAGFTYVYLPRSRTQDMFSFLIAQAIFLVFVWPNLRDLSRNLRRYLLPRAALTISPEPRKEL